MYKASVAVFCSCRTYLPEPYNQLAFSTGMAIARHELRLVYGGARHGLMGLAADGALEAGGQVFGVLPEFIQDVEPPHEGIQELVMAKTMPERKGLMFGAADATLVLPGGVGTMDEFFEMLVFNALGQTNDLIAVYDPTGFYDGIIQWLRRAEEEKFIRTFAELNFAIIKTEAELESWLRTVAERGRTKG